MKKGIRSNIGQRKVTTERGRENYYNGVREIEGQKGGWTDREGVKSKMGDFNILDFTGKAEINISRVIEYYNNVVLQSFLL